MPFVSFMFLQNPNGSLDGISDEMLSCDRTFYSMPRILRRVWGSLWGRRQPLISLVGNLSYRRNTQLNCKTYAAFKRYLDNRHDCVEPHGQARGTT